MSGSNAPKTHIDINDLNTQITIKSLSSTRDVMGGQNTPTETIVFAGVWANLYNTSGKTVYVYKQKESQVGYVVTIRYRKGIDPKMIVYTSANERLLITRVVDVDNRHEWVELYCDSLTNNGV